jgi:prepilin-type processing-associated H-X9-DG protein/prepilin-type N-terminal cleavage/methylation domain-containing protein
MLSPLGYASRGRRGLTLVELLVTIAVAAALIALLLPAVQKVRAAAAKSKCTNNLRQVGIAVHAYHGANGRLPTAVVSYQPPGTGAWSIPTTSWSWGTLLLPYLGQDPLYAALKAYDDGNGIDETGDYKASSGSADGSKFRSHIATPKRPELALPVSVYLCPVDSPLPTNPLFSYLPNENGRSSYVCNRDAFGPDADAAPTAATLGGIRDGTSNTFVVGERDGVQNVGAIWPLSATKTTSAVEGRPGFGINVPYPGGVPVGDRNAWDLDTDGDNVTSDPPYGGQRYAFTSRHAGGVNFLFADGSVRFVSNGVEANPGGLFFRFPNTNGKNTPKDVDCVLNNLYHPNDGNARTQTE